MKDFKYFLIGMLLLALTTEARAQSAACQEEAQLKMQLSHCVTQGTQLDYDLSRLNLDSNNLTARLQQMNQMQADISSCQFEQVHLQGELPMLLRERDQLTRELQRAEQMAAHLRSHYEREKRDRLVKVECVVFDLEEATSGYGEDSRNQDAAYNMAKRQPGIGNHGITNWCYDVWRAGR